MSNQRKKETKTFSDGSDWVERPMQVEPQPVSNSFIDAAQAAGARDSLVEALRAERKQVKAT